MQRLTGTLMYDNLYPLLMRNRINTLTTDNTDSSPGRPILLSEACASQAIQKSLDMILAVTGVCRVYCSICAENPRKWLTSSSQKFESVPG